MRLIINHETVDCFSTYSCKWSNLLILHKIFAKYWGGVPLWSFWPRTHCCLVQRGQTKCHERSFGVNATEWDEIIWNTYKSIETLPASLRAFPNNVTFVNYWLRDTNFVSRKRSGIECSFNNAFISFVLLFFASVIYLSSLIYSRCTIENYLHYSTFMINYSSSRKKFSIMTKTSLWMIVYHEIFYN